MISNTQAIPNKLQPHFSGLLVNCRNVCVTRLSALIKQMFQQADSALLEFANKAQSNMVQTRFFEAIREVHAKHDDVTLSFQKELANSFQRFAARDLAARSDKQFDRDALTLIDKDDVEETIAVQNLAQKSITRNMEAIYALGQRLAVVNGGTKVDDAFLPGGPHQIAKCYQTALSEIDVHQTVKIMMYALFDKVVMNEIGVLYEELNEILIQGGILKNLKTSVIKRDESSTDARPRHTQVARTGGSSPVSISHGDPSSGTAITGAPQSMPPSIEEELFNNIRELLCRKSLQPGGSGADTPPGSSQVSAEEARAISGSLLTSLGTIQHASVTSPHARLTRKDSSGYRSIDQGDLDNIKALLNDQRNAMYQGVDRRRMPALEQNVIELVGMMFDYMLSDENLPNAAKALLSRLHTPFLKIAIIDKDFFTRPDNQARKLLNAMAMAGVRWVTDNDLEYGLYPFMLATVERVLHEFDQDPSIFGQILKDFETGLEAHANKVALIEQRTLEAARGHERLESARQRASEVIQKAIGTRVLLPDAVNFLHDTWQDKLMFIQLRCGETAHGDCETAMNVTQRIVESLDVLTEPGHRDAIEARLPELRENLRMELQKLDDYGSEDLAVIYARISELQQASLSATEMPDALAKSAAALTNSPEKPKAEETLSPDELVILNDLNTAEFGTWFEFYSDTSGGYVKLKLAWHSRVTGNFMFVNQAGVRTAVIPRMELIRKITSGEVRYSHEEKQPFVDRAMAMIRRLLQKVTPEAVTHPSPLAP